MSAVALLYHDVVSGPADASGFPGAGAARYKLDVRAFEAHLAALDSRLPPPVASESLETAHQDSRWMLTFDDGGRSAAEPTARLLDARGWRAYFFITAGRIGDPAFLDREQIRALAAAGHIVGSHSMSHPPRMSSLPLPAIRDEWRRSVEKLEDVLGARVVTASVPGGYFSRSVAEAAAETGIGMLFTSEPVTRVRRVSGVMVLGRFALRRGDPPEWAVALGTGSGLARARQWTRWNTAKMLKVLGGARYDRVRERWLRGRDSGV